MNTQWFRLSIFSGKIAVKSRDHFVSILCWIGTPCESLEHSDISIKHFSVDTITVCKFLCIHIKRIPHTLTETHASYKTKDYNLITLGKNERINKEFWWITNKRQIVQIYDLLYFLLFLNKSVIKITYSIGTLKNKDRFQNTNYFSVPVETKAHIPW